MSKRRQKTEVEALEERARRIVERIERIREEMDRYWSHELMKEFESIVAIVEHNLESEKRKFEEAMILVTLGDSLRSPRLRARSAFALSRYKGALKNCEYLLDKFTRRANLQIKE